MRNTQHEITKKRTNKMQCNKAYSCTHAEHHPYIYFHEFLLLSLLWIRIHKYKGKKHCVVLSHTHSHTFSHLIDFEWINLIYLKWETKIPRKKSKWYLIQAWPSPKEQKNCIYKIVNLENQLNASILCITKIKKFFLLNIGWPTQYFSVKFKFVVFDLYTQQRPFYMRS